MSDKLQSVRDKIQQAFAQARKIPADIPMDCSQEIILDSDTIEKLVRQIPARPLRKPSTPTSFGRPFSSHVVETKKTAEELINAAVAATKKPRKGAK